VTALPGDYYHPEAGNTELVGEHTGATYRLTDQLTVKLVKVDVENRKIDFVPIASEADAPTKTKRNRRG
jgi:ribonuclease R